MCDPVGEPVERGYALLHKAIELGRGYEFARSFLSGVWADGIDAGSDRGLKEITERAGLSWSDMLPMLGGDHWQADAEANQAEMFSHGIWGVPSFRVGDTAIWGQDRLWVIEDALLAEQDKTK
jgi:2-hydroxychromene-2-carboxylate isomerase